MLINHNLIPISATVSFVMLFALNLRPISKIESKLLRLILVLIVGGVTLYLPIYKGCTLVQLLRGVMGDLSITTLLILFSLLIQKIFRLTRPFNLNPSFAIVVTMLGSLLYMSTLGFIDLDVYSFGYFPKGTMLLAVCLLELFLLDYARSYAWIWLIALISFYFKFESSNNLWDYLFDPLLWLIAIISFFRRQA